MSTTPAQPSPASQFLLVPTGILDPSTGITATDKALLVVNGLIEGQVDKSDIASLASTIPQVTSDGWLLPGFIDMHNYLSVDPDRPNPMGRMYSADICGRAWTAARLLDRDIRSGVTTLRVMGEGQKLDIRTREAIVNDEISGPNLITSGYPITPSNGHQRGPQGFDAPTDIAGAVRDNIEAGAEWIKIMLTGGVNSKGLGPRESAYSREQIRCAVREARQGGCRVSASGHGGPSIRIALEEGVDTIEHGSLFDNEDVNMAAEHNATVVLTLSRFFHPNGITKSALGDAAILSACEGACDAMRNAVPALLQSGVRLALGCDNMHGYMADDIAILVELGADIPTALAAATAGGARALGRNDIGGLKAGMRADFLLIPEDPRRDISALRRPLAVYKGGEAIA